jgi:hypothetical protein
MGYSQIVRGHVDSIARAINVSNAQPNHQEVATVNPVFTWVRLAQRIPVRIHIGEVPPGIVLAAEMTATAEVDARHLAPFRKDYKHHDTGEDNGDSHLKALLIHHEVIVPITGGKLDLGTWQRIFLCRV